METALDFSMFESAGRALLIILDPTRFIYLAGSVLLGLCIGLLPGIGGLTGFALLLPFTFTMEPYTAYACLLGMAAVINTSDTIPAVLIGVPGTASAQATVLDGLPMTKRGEAGRALAAAYVSSMLGGLFGALMLALAIPIVRPIVLAIATPELLAMTVLAISMVAALSGSTPLRGLVVACFGITLAMIGTAPQTGSLRWTMGTLYLWDGLPLLPIILGLYALPELCDLAIKRASQYTGGKVLGAREGMWQGIKDAFANWFLIIRCSGMGAAVGAIPGLSGSVVDWLAYGHALKTEKGAKETFGKGDVRGVIAPESANNATEGGALIPTLAFGMPGSASMALLIGALMVHGIAPGPDMLTVHLDLTYSMVWSIALANVVGAGICLAFSSQFAKLALVRFSLILPAILTVVYVGAFQGSRSWGDLFALLFFGVLGWTMKQLRWPRPPLILGFVLGVLIERYMSISIGRYGMEWLGRPMVICVLALAVFAITSPLISQIRQVGARTLLRFERPKFKPQDTMYLFFIAIFGVMVYQATAWKFEAKIGPLIVTIAAIILATLGLVNQVLLANGRRTEEASGAIFMDLGSEHGETTRKLVFGRAARFFGWLIAFMGSMATIGLIATIPFFVIGFMRVENQERWRTCIIYAVLLTLAIYVVFDQTLHLAWPPTLLGAQFPDLRGVIPAI
jgi:TctA family transporter